jgi:serine/threonine protein kinase
MHNGNILDFLEAFPYVDRVTMLGDVANHLEQLHSIGIVHGNLHPRNILVDESGSPLLVDFRLQATTLDAKFNNKENGYNVRYCSPEEIISPLGGALHAASDVYSFACTCLEILTSVPPFAELTSSMDVALALHSGQSPYNMSSCRVRENVTLACNPPLRKVLENSLHSNAARRPRMSTVLKAFSVLGGSVDSVRMSEQMETEPWIANAMLGRSFGSVTRKCKL